MTDVSLFIQHGWQNIWKQKTIWLFSALSSFATLFYALPVKYDQSLVLSLLYLLISLIFMVLLFVSTVGVPYLAYCFSIGKPASIQDTLLAVRKFAGRIIGCSCLGVLLISPCIFLAFAISLNNSTQPSQISNTIILLTLPLSVTSSLWDFSVFGFFANDWSIRKTIKNAWNLFTSHFVVLATLGILVILVFRISSAIFGILTVLIQTGFDVASISTLNLINPSTTLDNNLLFAVLTGISQMIYGTFTASILALAYLKYSGAKIPSLSAGQRMS